MQGTVNVEDVHELLKEARVSIMEVRKVHTYSKLDLNHCNASLNAPGADLKRLIVNGPQEGPFDGILTAISWTEDDTTRDHKRKPPQNIYGIKINTFDCTC